MSPTSCSAIWVCSLFIDWKTFFLLNLGRFLNKKLTCRTYSFLGKILPRETHLPVNRGRVTYSYNCYDNMLNKLRYELVLFFLLSIETRWPHLRSGIQRPRKSFLSPRAARIGPSPPSTASSPSGTPRLAASSKSLCPPHICLQLALAWHGCPPAEKISGRRSNNLWQMGLLNLHRWTYFFCQLQCSVISDKGFTKPLWYKFNLFLTVSGVSLCIKRFSVFLSLKPVCWKIKPGEIKLMPSILLWYWTINREFIKMLQHFLQGQS